MGVEESISELALQDRQLDQGCRFLQIKDHVRKQHSNMNSRTIVVTTIFFTISNRFLKREYNRDQIELGLKKVVRVTVSGIFSWYASI